MNKGVFITFEGGEGVGKTTQIHLLEQDLRAQGVKVTCTREPGGTPAAEELRNLLSHSEYGGKWSDEAELLLLFAARSVHIRDVIAPALEAGHVVLCDRYIDSTRAYQGHIHHMDHDFILDLERRVVGRYIPDMTIILDLPADQAYERVHQRGAQDHYDRGDLDFYERLRTAFLEIATQNTPRCCVIDAQQKQEEIAAQIKHAIEHMIG